MHKWFKDKIFLLPVFLFFIFYLLWLFRSYVDVAYMDEIQILAGNLNHMYNHDASLQDYYYRAPFLLSFSTILVFINCKLFYYNTYLENIISGLVLFLIALYYIKSEIVFFNNRYKIYFSIIAALVIFCLTKWELSLWGGGFSHYIVVLFGFICTGKAHKYYLSEQAPNRGFTARNFIVLYLFLSLVAILEATSYFLPFLLSILILLLINYRLFHDKINIKKWRAVMVTTIGLLIFAILINYLAEVYSAHHPYDGYGKVNLANSLGESFKKLTADPLFVVKFFLVSNAGNLIDKDSYQVGSFGKNIMPLMGLAMLIFYAYAMYLFVKRKKTEGIFAINLMLYTIIFYGTVLMGRLIFNDVYYGASSRYTAATFTGALGLATFFLLILDQKKDLPIFKKLIYSFPLLLIAVCSIVVNKNQWQIAPYRKEAFTKMSDNLKADKNLESLMGYNNEITENARQVMIKNRLNVFKPETKLNNYTLNSELSGLNISGFYDLETSPNGTFRWTKGNGIVFLPNLYTTKDTVKVKLKCFIPRPDTPMVILNDNLTPFRIRNAGDGYEFFFAFQEQKVFFKVSVQNRSFNPKEIDKNSPDTRTLGLIFQSLTFYN